VPNYTPASSNASEAAYAGRIITDLVPYSSYVQSRWDAKYGAQEIMNELLAFRDAAVSGKQYLQQFTCLTGLNVGDPVRISGNNTVVLALATTQANSRVVGFVRHKGTIGSASSAAALTCYLSHYRYVSGLTGGTAGNPCYLTDAGGFSATAGTYAKVVGVFTSTTEALLVADSVSGIKSLKLNDLLDVSATTPSTGDTIQWNGTAYVNAANATSDEKVKSDSGATAGYLDAAVDNSTIEVDATAHALRVKNSGITYAKIQNVSATDKLLGRSTAGAGVVEEIMCTSTGRSVIAAPSVAAARAVLALDTGDSPTFTGLTLSGTLNRYKRLISNKTGNYTILDTDSGTMFTNASAAGTVTLTLPTAAAGLTYVFVVKESQTLDIVRAGSDVIYDNNAGSNTHVSSNAVGRVIRLTAISAGIWVTESIVGTWSYA